MRVSPQPPTRIVTESNVNDLDCGWNDQLPTLAAGVVETGLVASPRTDDLSTVTGMYDELFAPHWNEELEAAIDDIVEDLAAVPW